MGKWKIERAKPNDIECDKCTHHKSSNIKNDVNNDEKKNEMKNVWLNNEKCQRFEVLLLKQKKHFEYRWLAPSHTLTYIHNPFIQL